MKISPQGVTRYITDGNGQALEELDVYYGLQYDYIYGNGEKLSKITTGGNKEYFHNDYLGSVRRVSTQSGSAPWSRDYYPFGEAREANSINNKYMFTGKERDEETESDNSWHRQYLYLNGRFSQADRFWMKYPSVSPYAYVLNNPLSLTDATGDTINVNETMANNEALGNFLNTEDGYNYASQFAYKGQSITVNGKTFTFENTGAYSKSNLNFQGVINSSAKTIPINSGVTGLVGKFGNQSYDIFISGNSLGNQMDDIFHEVQHTIMFESGSFSGIIGRDIKQRHHAAMSQGNLWNVHVSFVNNINKMYGVGLNASQIRQQTLINAVHPDYINNRILQY